jgi:hypothetical protein
MGSHAVIFYLELSPMEERGLQQDARHGGRDQPHATWGPLAAWGRLGVTTEIHKIKAI